MKKGFTLIELLMVIAIIAILSTLAVSKVGGLRESAARKVSIANQKAVERGIEAFLVSGGRLNRLDSLLYTGEGGEPLFGPSDGDFDFTAVSTAEGREGLFMGPSADAEATESWRDKYNSGLTPELRKVLCLYSLGPAQVKGFHDRLGLKFVMAQTAYADLGDNVYPSMHYPRNRAYGDGTVPNASDGLNPNGCAFVATAVTNRMFVAAVNPMTDLGRTIYQAFGQELMNTLNWGESYNETEVRAEVKSSGGPLLAFGLGDNCSAVGNANGGLESAPYATFPQKKYYTRYILLFRMKTVGSGSVSTCIPEFAGVLDCEGNTVRAAEHVVRGL